MSLEVEGLRPAFLLPEEADALDELRGFRHLYRNLYDKDIESAKTEALQAKFSALASMFFAAHERYLHFLEETAALVDK